MENKFYSLVTNYGIQKQLNSLEKGVEFDISEIVFGDGNGTVYEPNPTQTFLKKEVFRKEILIAKWENEKFYCITTIPANEGGFYIREAGILDRLGNLVAICKIPETYKQSPDSGVVKQLTIKIEINFLNNEIANLIVNSNINLATIEDLNLLQNSIQNNYQEKTSKGLANGYAPLDSNSLIPSIHLPPIPPSTKIVNPETSVILPFKNFNILSSSLFSELTSLNDDEAYAVEYKGEATDPDYENPIPIIAATSYTLNKGGYFACATSSNATISIIKDTTKLIYGTFVRLRKDITFTSSLAGVFYPFMSERE